MLILLLFVIIGTIIGLVFKNDATIVRPFGDLFLNMLLISVVPLIFLTISLSIYKMKQPKRIGKILGSTFFVFLITSFIAVLLGIICTYSYPLVDNTSSQNIKENLSVEGITNIENINYLERTINTISVNDFSKLLTNENMIALILVSILIGLAMNISGKKAEPVANFIQSAQDILFNFIKIIMYYAPIGLGCYFASLVGTFGTEIALGYLKTFIIYLIVCIICYFFVYGIYAYISAGIKGIKIYFRNIIPSTITALATCSSAASMPVNMDSTKKMGVADDIVDTTISIGTSFHKDGSVIGSVFKIMFLVYLFNDFGNISVTRVIFISLVATLLVSAVPIGGGTISEMLIITMLGYPIKALPILTIIATIIDPPATVLNVVGDSSSALLTSRLVDGANWHTKKEQNIS